MGQKNQDYIVLWRYGAKESGLSDAVDEGGTVVVGDRTKGPGLCSAVEVKSEMARIILCG